MTSILMQQIIVLFLMMACGYGLVKGKLLTTKDSRVLSILSIYLIIPFVIIKAFQIDFTDTVKDAVIVSLIAAVLINVGLVIIGRIAHMVCGMNHVEEASIVYSNAGNLIIPLVMSMFGDEWVIYASVYMCVQLVFMWTHGFSLMTGAVHCSWRAIIKNYNLLAIIIGIVLAILQIRLPVVMYQAMNAISLMIGPVCMILLGMVFAGTDMKEIFFNRRVYLVSLWAMVIGPLLILVLLKLVGLVDWVENGHTLLYISFLATMTPAATTITNMAQVYSGMEKEAVAINSMTTIISMITMPIMTFLYMVIM